VVDPVVVDPAVVDPVVFDRGAFNPVPSNSASLSIPFASPRVLVHARGVRPP
jgi:hypothetical protein